MKRRSLLRAGVGLAVSGGCGLVATDAKAIFPFGRRGDNGLEESAQPACGPGGMTITPNGEYIVACHQFYDPTYRVLRLTKDGQWVPFPNLEMNTGQGDLTLDAVLGLESDERGVVWMLDNGRRGESPAKLVAWDSKRNSLVKVITISENALVETSFLNDLALDPEEPFIYISDPASGDDAALIVVDIETGFCRRILHGDYTVIPEQIGLKMDDREVVARRPNGTREQAMRGANPIAVDRKGRWLYFGPMNGRLLYRVRCDQLRSGMPDRQLQIERYCSKPICDSISLDSKDTIYFGDIQAGAIGYAQEDGGTVKYYILIDDPRIIWPDGLCFGADGKLHFFCSQLNRSPLYNSGKARTQAPFYIFKIRALSEGTVGR